MKHVNPFDRVREEKKYKVAQMILSGTTVSWTDLIENVGSLSPRTMGYVLRGLEDQGATILRIRDDEHGTLYRYDPACEYDARFRLSKADGPDALRQKGQPNGVEQEAETA